MRFDVAPALFELTWLHETLRSLSQKSALAEAIRHALKLWTALVRYAGDGRDLPGDFRTT